MRHLVFVAPHFMENTNRFVAAFARLEGLRFSVISDDPVAAIPPTLRARISGGHYQVKNSLDGDQLAIALGQLASWYGPVDRLTGSLEQLQLPMAAARDATGTPGMGLVHATRFRDKDEMKRVLRAAGVPVARSTLAHTVGEIADFAKKVGFPLIVKPPAGLGSKSTWRVENAADVAALATLGLEAPLQVEQFVLGREHTCETVSVEGTTVWRSGTRYFPTPLEVLETPWMQYCVLLPKEADAAPWPAFHPTNETALQALFAGSPKEAQTGLTHMEWFLTEDGSMVVGEVGARPPGVQIMPLMSLAHETDAVADWAELIAFDRFTPKPRKWAAGAAFLRGHGTGDMVVRVDGLEEATDAVRDVLVDLKVPKVGMARNSSYEGEGHAVVRAPSTEAAKQALLTLIRTVQIRYG